MSEKHSHCINNFRYRIEMDNQKFIYIESSDEEDGPSSRINERLSRATVSSKNAHFLMWRNVCYKHVSLNLMLN